MLSSHEVPPRCAGWRWPWRSAVRPGPWIARSTQAPDAPAGTAGVEAARRPDLPATRRRRGRPPQSAAPAPPTPAPRPTRRPPRKTPRPPAPTSRPPWPRPAPAPPPGRAASNTRRATPSSTANPAASSSAAPGPTPPGAGCPTTSRARTCSTTTPGSTRAPVPEAHKKNRPLAPWEGEGPRAAREEDAGGGVQTGHWTVSIVDPVRPFRKAEMVVAPSIGRRGGETRGQRVVRDAGRGRVRRGPGHLAGEVRRGAVGHHAGRHVLLGGAVGDHRVGRQHGDALERPPP